MIDPSLIDPGEQLIWQGKPYPIRYALRKAAYTFPFGIFFFGFSLFWIYGAYMAGNKATNQVGFAFWMFGIPFVIVGACMVLSPAWYLFRATTTTYALTDQRVIIDNFRSIPTSHKRPAQSGTLCRCPFFQRRARARSFPRSRPVLQERRGPSAARWVYRNRGRRESRTNAENHNPKVNRGAARSIVVMSRSPILGLVLAGGLARRMGGGDKTRIRIGGTTILERVLTRFKPQC